MVHLVRPIVYYSKKDNITLHNSRPLLTILVIKERSRKMQNQDSFAGGNDTNLGIKHDDAQKSQGVSSSGVVEKEGEKDGETKSIKVTGRQGSATNSGNKQLKPLKTTKDWLRLFASNFTLERLAKTERDFYKEANRWEKDFYKEANRSEKDFYKEANRSEKDFYKEANRWETNILNYLKGSDVDRDATQETTMNGDDEEDAKVKSNRDVDVNCDATMDRDDVEDTKEKRNKGEDVDCDATQEATLEEDDTEDVKDKRKNDTDVGRQAVLETNLHEDDEEAAKYKRSERDIH